MGLGSVLSVCGGRPAWPGGGFTLTELLVVISIVAVLMGMLIPALAKARDHAQAIRCAANLKGIGEGLVVYNSDNQDFVVPSYNMTGNAAAGDSVPLDGWAPNLDRDGVVPGKRDAADNVFYCPNTAPILGMAGGDTGADPNKSRGYFEWPTVRKADKSNNPVIIPQRGFNRIIRVAYWVNSANPIGSAGAAIEQDVYYTGSVGFENSAGRVMRLTRCTCQVCPSALIALADGLYAGKQGSNRLNGTDGVSNSRVGFRHAGGQYTNAAFADGHVTAIRYSDFPRTAGAENQGAYTIYADPASHP